ncbi:V-type ATP synthase subunit E [Patescibacteria group bacterium]|nr:V-type ATP synthase subunit E [Patescibacteria group bacterium]
MALSDILAKIQEEAQKRLKEIDANFERKHKSLKEKYDAAQKEVTQNLHTKLEENTTKILQKAENIATMDAKNKMLKAKRELIEEIFDAAIEKLAASDKYQAILTAILEKIDLGKEDVVIVPAKGKEEATKEAIKASKQPFMLSDKASNIIGGFIAKTDKREIDNSFETIIKNQLRENLEIDLNKLLF